MANPPPKLVTKNVDSDDRSARSPARAFISNLFSSSNKNRSRSRSTSRSSPTKSSSGFNSDVTTGTNEKGVGRLYGDRIDQSALYGEYPKSDTVVEAPPPYQAANKQAYEGYNPDPFIMHSQPPTPAEQYNPSLLQFSTQYPPQPQYPPQQQYGHENTQLYQPQQYPLQQGLQQYPSQQNASYYQQQPFQYNPQFYPSQQNYASQEQPPPQPQIVRKITEEEDDYAQLATFDTVFLIDDSKSMETRSSTTTKETHWETVRRILEEIVPICAKYDTNGVDVHFLNSREVLRNATSEVAVMNLFKKACPSGMTPTASKLKEITKGYIKECEKAYLASGSKGRPPVWPKPRNIIVLTDGRADDPDILVDYIADCAQKLDKWNAPLEQLGIQMFQVGNMAGVRAFMAELDNALTEQRGVRDIVDTVPAERMGKTGLTRKTILKIVLGGVIDEYDEMMVKKSV